MLKGLDGSGRPRSLRNGSSSAAEDDVDDFVRRPRDDLREGAPPVRGARTITGVLPSGRTVWLGVAPAPAPLDEVNRLARSAGELGDRRDRAITWHSDAIERLGRRIDGDTTRLVEAGQKRAGRLARRLARASAGAEARTSERLARRAAELERQAEMEWTSVERLRSLATWDTLLVASSLPLFAAFGQRRGPLASNNLTLALSLLVWLVGDEVAALLSPPSPDGELLRQPDVWSYLSPALNVLTGWFLLHDGQHERFITGLASDFKLLPTAPSGTTLAANRSRVHRYVQQIDLTARVAPDHAADFQTFANVPAVASLVRATFPHHPPGGAGPGIELTSRVEEGVLVLTIEVVERHPSSAISPTSGSFVVAWMVDSSEPR
jgi:hypothetical protein